MNKLVKVFNLLKVLTSDEKQILDNIKELKMESTDKEYFFAIDLVVPLPTTLYYKINSVCFNGIKIHTKINKIDNINDDDIVNYLLDYCSQHKNTKYLKKHLQNKNFDFDENVFSLNYITDIELAEFKEHEQSLINIFKNAFGISNILIQYIFDEKFQKSMQEKKEVIKKEFQKKLKETNDTANVKTMLDTIKIEGKILPLKDLIEGQNNINITGEIFDIEVTETSKTHNFKFLIYDYENTFMIKHVFFKESEFKSKKQVSMELLNTFKVGDWVVANVDIKSDRFEKEPHGLIKKIKTVTKPSKYQRIDDAENKRIELMVHTKMSSFDAINDVEDVFKLVQQLGMNTVGFCDRHNIQSYPEIQKCAKKYNIKPIYGVETEVLPNICKCAINETSDPIDNTYVIFDLETTGLYPEYDDIIEFGAIKTNGIQIIDRVQFFIKPTKPISAASIKLTGITNEMVKDAIDQKEGIQKILNYIGTCPVIAHNAINFDYCFLVKKAEKYLKYEINNPVIDTMLIARALYPTWKTHRLQKVCDEFNIEYNQEDAHRADYDANVLFQCWVKIVEDLKKNNITTIEGINKLTSKTLLSKYVTDLTVIYNRNNNSLRTVNELVSLSYTSNFFGKPTINKNFLETKRKDLILACDPTEGDVFRIAVNGSEKELKRAIAFYDYIFVSPPCDLVHFYKNKEICLQDVENVVKKIIELSVKQNKKVIAVNNSFHLTPWDKKFQYVYLYAKGLGGHRHRYFKFGELPNSHIKTTQEMIDSFAFLNNEELAKQIVVDNVNDFISEVSDDVRPIKDKLYTPKMDNVDNLLKDKVYETANRIYGQKLPDLVEQRLQKELNSIISNEFSVIYWISHLLVKKSLSDGYVVGSRGSVGSSLVAYMLNITDVNPLQPHYICQKCHYFELVDTDVDDGFDLKPKLCPQCKENITGEGHNIPFETFLGFKCDKVPDIDLNFSGLYQATAHNFIKEMFGESHAFRAGTISTIATKISFGYVKSYFDEIHSFNVPKSDLNLYVKKCQDVKRTTGQHPGGILIVPKEYSIFDFSPYNYPADVQGDWYTTHYAFEHLHDNLLKFDILGHDNPTILKKLKDLTSVDEKDIPNYDENVMNLFSSIAPLKVIDSEYFEKNGAISIPEFGTKFVREMLVDTQPKTFSDLIRISGLSHGTDVYIGNAKSLIKNENLKLKNVIACRDDILNYLLNQGIENSTAFKIMEDVRKGKGLKQEYVDVMLDHNVPKWYIDSCNKIKYIFPKAHATAYVMHAWKFAWYKIYYPLPYYATYFSTKPDVFDIETIIKGKNAVLEKRDDISARLADKNEAANVKKKEIDLLGIFDVVLEMFARGFAIEKPNIIFSLADEFIIKDNKLIAPFSVIDGIGSEVAQSIVDARDKQAFTSMDDVSKRTKLNKTSMQVLERIGVFDSLPKNDQIKLFDI